VHNLKAKKFPRINRFHATKYSLTKLTVYNHIIISINRKSQTRVKDFAGAPNSKNIRILSPEISLDFPFPKTKLIVQARIQGDHSC
jgi:hypothetical protein